MPIDHQGDILATIQVGDIKIGIDSQGDPNSRIIAEQNIQKLADVSKDSNLGGCGIII